MAASGPTVAEVAGRLGDGFLTPPATDETYRDVLFPALEKGLKSSGRAMEDFSKSLEVWMTYDEDPEAALNAARPWAESTMPVFYKMAVFDSKGDRGARRHGGK